MRLDYKLDDFEILNEEVPTVKIVGRSFLGFPKIIETIIIDELPIGKFYIFVRDWPIIMARHIDLIKLAEVNLTDLDNESKLDDVRVSIQRLLSYSKFRKDYIKFIRDMGLTKLSAKKFERYVKPSQLATIFVYLYRMNVDGLKKKLMSLLEKCYSTRIPMSEIYIPSLSQKDGLKTKVLQPRYQRLSSVN